MHEARASSADASHVSQALSTQRDSLSHDAIPLGASMWLDDMGTPSARASVSSSSLEDSLQLLHTHGGTHAALSFDEDDSVHSLFPMLSESSFDYDDDNHSHNHHHNKALIQPAATPAVVAPESVAFPNDLSPILTAVPMPKSLDVEPAHTITPRHKKKAAPPHTTQPQAPLVPITIGHAVPFPQAQSPVGIRKRRRLRSTSLSTTLAHWTPQEQNVFFSVFKAKWPAATKCEASGKAQDFAALLATRFEIVSHRLRGTTKKTSHDAQAFYQIILRNITELLELLVPHDIDLRDPDEIRIALRCWHKFTSDDHMRQQVERLDDATEQEKKPLAMELQKLIVRSRRQMRKATKQFTALRVGAAAAAADGDGLTTADLPETSMEDEEEMKSLEGLLREALEHSSLPSYLYQLAPPLQANATPVVHHLLVRKKSAESSVNTNTTSIAATVSLKRQRSESVELYHAFTNGTPLQSLSSISETAPMDGTSVAAAVAAQGPSFVTPPMRNNKPASKRSKTSHHGHHHHQQTPPQSSRKKIYIKLRMVPRDTQTKDLVERCGCNPKVELKLSSSKKVSDVLDHMAKKWAAVHTLVDRQATLHFFQKSTTSTGSPSRSPAKSGPAATTPGQETWSRRNHDVTCLDMWKRVGKMKNDEYIAVVSYQWRVDESTSTTDGEKMIHDTSSSSGRNSLSAWMDESTPLLDLFGDGETQKKLPFELEAGSSSSSSGDSSKENSPFTSPLQTQLQPQPQLSSAGKVAMAQVQPLGGTASSPRKQSLMEFSETVAFDTKSQSARDEDEEQLSLASLPDDALSELLEFSPNSQRLRRRITPVLVATSECHI